MQSDRGVAMNFSITLSDHQVGEIAQRVAEIIAAEKSVPNLVPTSRWLSPPEAASLLRCDTKRVYTMVSDGRLTRHREGRRLLLDRSEVESMVTSG